VVPCAIPFIYGKLSVEKVIFSEKRLLEVGVNIVIDEVVSIYPNVKEVKTASGKEIKYDKLILATGSNPIKPKIPNIELKNIFPVEKKVEVLRKLYNALEKASSIAIVGGGVSGVEFAADIREKSKGKEICIIEILPHCLQTYFDVEFCEMVEKKLRDNNIKIYTNTKVESFEGDSEVKFVKLSNGEKLRVDVVLLCVGMQPNTFLADNLNLPKDVFGRIKVNGKMETKVKDIFAVGDCCAKMSLVTEKPNMAMLASIAALEGVVAGLNIAGFEVELPYIVAAVSTKIFDLGLGVTGFTEDTAKKEGMEVVVGTSTTYDKHPASMPETKTVTTKLVFLKNDGRLVGGQVAGGSTTGEIINTLTLAIQAKMKINDLIKIQFTSQPQLTPPPIYHPIILAAENAAKNVKKSQIS
ncbi:MAG: FAD-dependent oxidoreductase, partial [Candidatus Bathyarchaeota archaeon]|nr:FAD-dependent oxidoreductase [Candidatus Bathyarchaeota archaeon]